MLPGIVRARHENEPNQCLVNQRSLYMAKAEMDVVGGTQVQEVGFVRWSPPLHHGMQLNTFGSLHVCECSRV